MKINKTIATAVILFGLLVGGLGAGVLLSRQPSSVNAAPAAQQGTSCTDDDDVQHEAEGEDAGDNEDADCENETNETDEANEAGEAGEANEAGEAGEAVSPDQAGITADEAKAAAEAAYPGAKALEVELEKERGIVVYEVGLDNGMEVQINPSNGDVLGPDAR